MMRVREGKGGVEANPRISRPGFGAAGGVVRGGDAGGELGSSRGGELGSGGWTLRCWGRGSPTQTHTHQPWRAGHQRPSWGDPRQKGQGALCSRERWT